jgi:glycosyltransferase involved in cell wall biosynthesis
MSNSQKVVIDCERMKYTSTGLYHFCKKFSTALINENLSGDNNIELLFYMPKAAIEPPFNSKNTIRQTWWHKIFNPTAIKKQLWHTTYQSSNYFSKIPNQKKILTIHDLNFMLDDTKSIQKKNKYLKSVKKKVNDCNHVTAISKFSMEFAAKYIDFSKVQTSVIYNGCNVPENIVAIKPALQVFNRPFIFSIGTIVRKKNFHVLPAMLAKTDFNLIIAGVVQDDDYKKKIIDEAKKNGVENRVIFLGEITENEKWWLYKNMEAFVFPSIAEGFGLPVIEAMYFGKPVLLSNYTSLPEIGGANAYYFNSFDGEEMRMVMQNALNTFSNERALASITHAKSFSWNNAAIDYLNLYKQILSTH